MRSIRSLVICLLPSFSLLVAMIAACEDLPDVQLIIQRSIAANQADWEAAPAYSCYVREQEQNGAKTYEELVLSDSSYRRLIAVNDTPLPAEEEQREEQKLQEEIRRREQESADARARRIAKYERERNRDRMLMEQLTAAFNFKLVGKEQLGDRDVYVIDVTPKPGYRASNLETKLLAGMRGRLWIDAKEFRWVRAEAEAIRPVYIAGFIARVEPGTRFELEKTPVEPGVWLTSHFAARSRATIGFVLPEKKQENERYFNCSKQKAPQLGSLSHRP